VRAVVDSSVASIGVSFYLDYKVIVLTGDETAEDGSVQEGDLNRAAA